MSERSTYLMGCISIIAGTTLACAALQLSLWGGILFGIGVLLVWYHAERASTKLFWTITPPLVWLIRVMVLFSGTH
ncbi:MAG: hypothetical protein IPI55_14025 [Flavobacteriales bacterium]|nr:hypothetical protein [Flavobacteriales bacterium]